MGAAAVEPVIIDGRFELREELGRGASAVVYAAVDRQDGSEVALKLLRLPDERARGGAGTAEALVRFHKEVASLAALADPAIVRFRAAGELPDGGAYIAMERLFGRLLSDLAAEFPLDPERAVRIARAVARALARAHEAGILHRDVKPSNIFVCDGPSGSEAKLLDFGLARLHDATDDAVGWVAGTYAYMSPEQAGVLQRPVDDRSDLYSLGVVLYEMLAGRLPFEAGTLGELLHHHVAKRPESLRALLPEIPVALDAVVQKLLEKDPDDRYQTAESLAADLAMLGVLAPAVTARGAAALDASRSLRTLRREAGLVGREPALAAIQRALEAASGGQRRVLVIEGPEGAGKSRLLNELRQRALARGAVHLAARADPSPGRAPYEPVLEAISAHLESLRRTAPGEHARIAAEIEEGLRGWGEGLLAVLPELGTRRALGGTAKRFDLEPAQERRRFVEALVFVLARFAGGGGPTVLALEGLEQADEETARLFERLAGAGTEAAILAVATLDPEAAGEGAPGCAFAATLDEAGSRARILRLAPLSPEDAREVALAHLRSLGKPTAALLDLAVERSEGLPGRLVAFLRDLVERGGLEVAPSGELRLAAGFAGVAPGPAPAGEGPTGALAGLPEPIGKGLAAAACLRRPFSFLTAAAALAASPDATLEVLDAGIARGLLAGGGRRATYRIPSEARRRALRDGLERQERRAIHRRIAAHLGALAEADPERAPLEIAHHLEEAGEPASAIPHLLAAGDRALAVLAFEDARAAYERAAALAAGGPDGADGGVTGLVRALFGQGEALAALGRFDEARAAFARAIPLAATPRDRARTLVRLGGLWLKSGATGRALDSLTEALRELDGAPPRGTVGVGLSVVRAALVQIVHAAVPKVFRSRRVEVPEERLDELRVFNELIYLLYFVDPPRCIEIQLRALNQAERVGRTRELAELYATQSVLCGLFGLFGAAGRYVSRASEIARERGDGPLAAQAAMFRGMIEYWAGRYEAAEKHLGRAEATFASHFDPWRLNAARTYRGWIEIRRGRFEAARRIFEDVAQMSRAVGDERGLAVGALGVGEALIGAGRIDEADARITEARRRFGTMKDHLFLVLAERATARIAMQRAQWAVAIEALEASLETIRRHRIIGDYVVETYALLALVLTSEPSIDAATPAERRARLKRARRVAARARRLARRFPNAGPEAARAAGEVALAAGRRRRAMARFREAAALARGLGQKPELARAYLDLARTLREADPRRAALLVRAAEEAWLETEGDPKAGAGGGGVLDGQRTTSKTALLSERRKLESLLAVGKVIHAMTDVDELLGKVLEIAIEVTGAERGVLLLFEDGQEGTRRPVPKAWRITNEPAAPEGATVQDLGVSETVLADAERRRAPVVHTDAAAEAGLAARRSVSEPGLRSILCVPLGAREVLLGFLYLDNRLVRGLFGSREIDLVNAFAAQAGLAIANARAMIDLERANLRLRETQAQLVQSAKMSAIGQIAAGVSHEIRNPLNIIAGSIYYLRDLLKDAPQPKISEYLGHIEAEVRRATSLLEKLLDFARPAPGPFERVDVNALVERSLPLIAKMAQQRHLSVAADLAEGLPPVDGSPGELQQVLVNLLLNAVQANEEGGGRITVATRMAERAGEDGRARVAIEVADTGVGIDRADLEHVFEPFFTRREGGTGLGLFICYGIVERHGGRIEVASERGKGSRFTVTLPASSAALAAGEAPVILG